MREIKNLMANIIPSCRSDHVYTCMVMPFYVEWVGKQMEENRLVIIIVKLGLDCCCNKLSQQS